MLSMKLKSDNGSESIQANNSSISDEFACVFLDAIGVLYVVIDFVGSFAKV